MVQVTPVFFIRNSEKALIKRNLSEGKISGEMIRCVNRSQQKQFYVRHLLETNGAVEKHSKLIHDKLGITKAITKEEFNQRAFGSMVLWGNLPKIEGFTQEIYANICSLISNRRLDSVYTEMKKSVVVEQFVRWLAEHKLTDGVAEKLVERLEKEVGVLTPGSKLKILGFLALDSKTTVVELMSDISVEKYVRGLFGDITGTPVLTRIRAGEAIKMFEQGKAEKIMPPTQTKPPEQAELTEKQKHSISGKLANGKVEDIVNRIKNETDGPIRAAMLSYLGYLANHAKSQRVRDSAKEADACVPVGFRLSESKIAMHNM